MNIWSNDMGYQLSKSFLFISNVSWIDLLLQPVLWVLYNAWKEFIIMLQNVISLLVNAKT